MNTKRAGKTKILLAVMLEHKQEGGEQFNTRMNTYQISAFKVQGDVNLLIHDVSEGIVHHLGHRKYKRHKIKRWIRLCTLDESATQRGQRHDAPHPSRIDPLHEKREQTKLKKATNTVYQGIEL